jgi:alpha-amylase
MPAVVLYFHAHQPYRIKPYDLFSIGEDHQYYDTNVERLDNQKILAKVALKCYLPTNEALLELLNQYPEFKVSFSLSGVFLDQLERYLPHVLSSFQALVKTGRVELLNETYYHSLAVLYSEAEFQQQVSHHAQRLKDLFDYTPTAFRNTELIYSNDIARKVDKLGFKTILAEGVERYLGWRSPNFVYRPQGLDSMRVLLKNYKLSDDIAFRFSQKSWDGWPLTAEKFAHWVNAFNGNGNVINLFMDYETFGEHQWADTGIFDFLRALPHYVYQHPDNRFMTVSEASSSFPVSDTIDYPEVTSWADLERDVSAWLGNPMQLSAAQALYQLRDQVLRTQNQALIEDWKRLSTSDHLYYMCTKWFSDGDVHKYFSPNHTPYEAYNHFFNVLHDIRQRVYAVTSDRSSDVRSTIKPQRKKRSKRSHQASNNKDTAYVRSRSKTL